MKQTWQSSAVSSNEGSSGPSHLTMPLCGGALVGCGSKSHGWASQAHQQGFPWHTEPWCLSAPLRTSENPLFWRKTQTITIQCEKEHRLESPGYGGRRGDT